MNPLLTASGRQVDLSAPQPKTIKMVDIALALSRIPRFGGHTLRTWSVADHSLLVADLMGADTDPAIQLAALLHDAHEAYIGDLILPLQDEIQARSGTGYPSAPGILREIRNDLDAAIEHAFALPKGALIDPAIKAADRLALAIEARLLMSPDAGEWPGMPTLPDPLPALPKRDQMAAQNHFIIRALTLIQARHGLAKEWQVSRVEAAPLSEAVAAVRAVMDEPPAPPPEAAPPADDAPVADTEASIQMAV